MYTKEQVAKSIDEVKHAGYVRGRNAASWVEVFDIGTPVRWPDESRPREIADADEQWEFASAWAYAAESEGRQFSPFEFTAFELNDRDDADEAWSAFDAGVSQGIDEELAARRAKYETKEN